MGLILHHCHQARSMRSLWLIGELGLGVEVVLHGFGPELRDPDYLALHPLGRVPLLIDGPLHLMESGAICEYLCETYGAGTALWRPPGDPERAAWLQWLHFAETLGQHLAALTQQHVVIREDCDRSPLVMKLEARRLEKALGVLEAALAGRDHLLGGFSAVDTGIGYGLHVARHFVRFDAFPRLEAYRQRLEARPAFRAACPPTGAELIYSRPFYAAWQRPRD